MIPKKIHYCWFGRGEKPKLAVKCINSWKKHCPDYEIIEWNEDNFDVNMNGYTRMCYEQKKYAFLTDYARLIIINQCGGIYFDTDVEVIRSLDPLLEHRAFFGFETGEYLNTGEGFGCENGHPILESFRKEYDELLEGNKGIIGCPILNTNALVKAGFTANGSYQEKEGIVLYPIDYFNPYDDPTGKLNVTENTYSIHWYGKSWMDKKKVIRSHLTRPFHRLFGKDFFRRLLR